MKDVRVVVEIPAPASGVPAFRTRHATSRALEAERIHMCLKICKENCEACRHMTSMSIKMYPDPYPV
eukprot:6653607-Pyramimonas_sp.AAC.2